MRSLIHAVELLYEEVHRSMAHLGIRHPYEASEVLVRAVEGRAGQI
jgi:hypothetical protein